MKKKILLLTMASLLCFGCTNIFQPAFSLQNDQPSANAYLKKGSLYHSAGEYKKAADWFTQAIETAPKDALSELYILRAYTYSKLSQFDKAIADTNTAVKLRPTDTHSYAAQGMVYYQTGNDIEALKAFNKALEIDPDNESAYYGRGLVYYETQKFEKAIADFKKAIKLNPESADNYYIIADFYDAVENYKEAHKCRKIGDKLSKKKK